MSEDDPGASGGEFTVEVFRVDAESELSTPLAIRREVFVAEQGVPEGLELDGRDEEATHFLARLGGEAVGTARLREYDDGVAKVERVAIREPHRGAGWGERLMTAVESHAREAGFERVRLAAQVPVVRFYERLGYETVGEEFEDAGIRHRTMVKSLG